MSAASHANARLFSAVAIKSQIIELVGIFERSHDFAVDAEFDLNPNVAKRVLSGDAFNVGITNPWYVSGLINQGKAAAETHVPFGRVPLAIAKRSGSSCAPLTSHEEIRYLLLQATAIAYTSEETSGKTFLEVAGRIRVWDEISQRTRPMASLQGFDGSGAGPAQEMLELGEGLFACRGLLTTPLLGIGSKASWPSMD